ncbi:MULTISPECIES: penicillin-binding protein 1C [unclassified Flavobacterium]|uniref:penicillin-binding protein 1C n=1 Tax=unclassified Flavobacterium TaxID=196869 RepID=UPI001F12D726|nr:MULTISPECIES: penicillin-binding protein 1C [unclassified Flavobacterium]UMY66074.1 penicillin-binding protein 1C [Flavobacterium sp. HJ-32-4]
MKQRIQNGWRRLKGWVRRHPIKSALTVLLLVGYYFCLPDPLFETPYSTVLESSNGELLGAKIARDGQWRFPQGDSIPVKFQQCLIYFEDQHFRSHPGFNPVAMVNAVRQNAKAGRVVRGGSTLTQQVIRLSRDGKKRSYFEKAIEIILATRLECRYSKDEIIGLYAAHAPFGGNVVGLEMASWRYFGVRPHQLSWAESATLAVLPNAPSLIYPGKNQEKLRAKRDRLLAKLWKEGVIDEATYRLSVAEPLPQKPYPLPTSAPHLLQRVAKTREGQWVRSTVDIHLQQRANELVRFYYGQYRQNEIYNMAVLVLDVHTRNVIAYVGNTPTDSDHQKDVDIIGAPRSTGSILKPLLYASMLDEGQILPHTLVADVPTQISGYTPQNFNQTYDGAVPASRALSRSLNIPAVLMLQDYGIGKFYDQLHRFRLRDINRPVGQYGLSLILGGAESNLWDLCRTYAGLSSTVTYFNSHQARYRKGEFAEPNLDNDLQVDFGEESFQKTIVGAGSIYLAYLAMEEVNRPEGDEAWKFYDSSRKVAWKTGTSFGNRDAWAIGSSPDYVVGVWVGNATGEGRPELTGVGSAAPVMFDVFNLLPRKRWFATPLNDLEEVEVCAQSGFLPQTFCPTRKEFVPLKGKTSSLCPYHKQIHTDVSGRFRVNSSCEAVDNIVTRPWFVLPPVMEWYYRGQHIDYEPLPPFRPGCQSPQQATMDFIYPKAHTKIYLTKNFDSQVQPVIIKVAHSDREKQLFWYIDHRYVGSTKTFHEMPLKAKTGRYDVTVTDEDGNEIHRVVEIVRN